MTIDCSNKEVIGRLYEKMAAPAMAKVYSLVKRRDLAAEVAHDAFIKLMQHGGQFENERAVYGWIYRVCHNAAIDHLRSAAPRYETGLSVEGWGGIPDEGTHGAGGEQRVISHEILQRYLSILSDQEAQAFLYAYVDGMIQVEIAEVMGISRRTTQRLLQSAQEKIEEQKGRDHR